MVKGFRHVSSERYSLEHHKEMSQQPICAISYFWPCFVGVAGVVKWSCMPQSFDGLIKKDLCSHGIWKNDRTHYWNALWSTLAFRFCWFWSFPTKNMLWFYQKVFLSCTGPRCLLTLVLQLPLRVDMGFLQMKSEQNLYEFHSWSAQNSRL